MKSVGELESVFGAKVHVDQGHVGVQILVTPKRLSAIGRQSDHIDSRATEHRARGVAKISAVIDYQATHVALRANTLVQRRRSHVACAFPLTGSLLSIVRRAWAINIGPSCVAGQ